MKYLILITIVYVIIIILELYLVDRYIKNQHKKFIDLNTNLNENNDKENEFICNELKKRIEKLKTMSYKDWLKYNQENILIDFEKEKLYFFIYELSKKDNLFYLRTHIFEKYLNMEVNTFLSYIKDKSAYFNQYNIEDNVSKDIYYANEWNDGCSLNSYVWIDPFLNDTPIIKRTVSKKFKKVENGEIIDGHISVGYTSIILINKTNYYFEVIKNYYIFILFIFIYFIIIISYYIDNKEKIKIIILSFILNGYLMFTFLTKDIITNIEYENRRIISLDSSILGISFLVVANIFILNTLKNNKTMSLYHQSGFLFCTSIVALLLAMFKITNNFTQIDVKTHRVQNQILFNISIIINIFIFFNYFISIYSKKKSF